DSVSTTLAPDSQLKDLGYQPSLNRQLPFGSLLVYGLLFSVPMAPVAVFGLVVNRSGGVPVLVYLVAAAVMGLSAISYREMALRFPVAGSVYGYTRFSLGRTPGFIAGWLILLDYILMPALLTVLSAVALAH
ncbi:amino acid permease, partial [Bacillus cereus]